MGNEVFLLIAGYFFIGGLTTAMRGTVEQWQRVPLRDAPYGAWLYMINCVGVDVFLILYAYTKWGG